MIIIKYKKEEDINIIMGILLVVRLLSLINNTPYKNNTTVVRKSKNSLCLLTSNFKYQTHTHTHTHTERRVRTDDIKLFVVQCSS